MKMFVVTPISVYRNSLLKPHLRQQHQIETTNSSAFENHLLPIVDYKVTSKVIDVNNAVITKTG